MGTDARPVVGSVVGSAVGPVVGYVSGVFDMFHIGHLNLIMRARARCDRLVVGVVTDDVVRRVKGHDPVIPLAERLDILRGLRDVDDVLADPYADKDDTWHHLLPFDVLFKGDDWRGTPRAIRLEARLAQVGARIEYFPYTAQTSSTLLRDVLSRLAHTPVDPDPWADQVAPTAGRRGQPPYDGGAAPRRCEVCGQPTGHRDATGRGTGRGARFGARVRAAAGRIDPTGEEMAREMRSGDGTRGC